jgi:S1-C subfamily serine protease
MSEILIELSDALAQITERAATHLVAVHSGPRGSFSGIVWRSGAIVTADHALRNDEEIRVTLPDQREVSATLAGRDSATDIAVLRCAEAVSAPALLADAAALRAGHLTLVVGCTRVSGPVAALGTVSLAVAERKQWGGAVLAPYLRLDVNLQPTAVGGAVLDVRGALVGMATPKFGRLGAIAIPAATVDRIADVLLTRGRIPRGYLGVGLQSVRVPSELLSGVARRGRTATIVLDVAPAGPAHDAGILIGDLILSLGGKEILHPGDVHALLGPESVGKTLPLSLVRAGKIQDLQIVVAERSNGDN